MSFAAVDPERSGRKVELRVLVAAGDPTQRQRVEQRLRLAALLRHATAWGVEELNFEHEPPFAVLPSFEGERLDLRVSKTPTEVGKAWAWSKQLGTAIVEAHRLGLPSGRLGPSSVSVVPPGDLLVDMLALDFGVGPAANAYSEANRLDRAAVAPERMGSPYTEMSMSQSSLTTSLRTLKREPAPTSLGEGGDEATRRAEALAAEQAVDVFSLASIWYLLWFREPLSVSVWHRLTTSTPVDALPEYPTDLARSAPELEGFAELLSEMLATEPSDRPTAREAVQRLETLRPGRAKGAAAAKASASIGATFDTIGLGATHDAPWRPDGEPDAPATASAPQQRILRPGDSLGRFEILAKLGEGGMGTVYRARDPLADRVVAIKVLAPHLARSEGARRRFMKEARVLAAVNNPYVANLYEFNQDGDLLYLVLEYVPGRSVDKLLAERGVLSEVEAVAVAADVARALVDAHRHGVVHRDVKPENILLVDEVVPTAPSSETEPNVADAAGDRTPNPSPLLRAKLTDFGIAGVRDASESMAITQAGSMLGTPLYMAPEQWEKGANVDAASDVYSLGATLFHLLAGRPPFTASDPMTLMKLHCLEAAPSVREVNPHLSDVIDGVVARALAKSPAERFPDAESMLEALERHLRGEPTTAEAHPKLPEYGAGRVYEALFSWDLEAPPEKLWPLVSNTDRVNHTLGLPSPTWETKRDENGLMRRFASATLGMIKLRWEEHPFEWVENRRLSVLREFDTGPFEWFTSTVELQPRPEGGTHLTHCVRVLPRGLIGRLAAMFEIGFKAKRQMNKLYLQLDDWLSQPSDGEWTDPYLVAASVPLLNQVRIRERTAHLRERSVDSEYVAALEHYLLHASDQLTSRMRPWALADELKLDRNVMLSTLLHASQVGLVKMMWDVLCPVCRIPSESHESLKLLQEHGRCEACHLDFKLDFARSVELFFRGHPEVRDSEPRTYCIGGPGFSPHVTTQVRLAPRERFELTLQLPPGDYVLRSPQLPYAVEFIVDPRAAATRWDHEVGRRPALTEVLRFGPQRQTIKLTNIQEQEVVVRIERTASRSDAVTAAFASSFGPFREMMPRELLASGRAGAVPTVTILFAAIHQAESLYTQLGDAGAFDVLHRAFQTIDRIVQQHEGAVVKTIGGGALTVFPQMEPALNAATLIARELATFDGPRLALQACLHRGPAMLTTINQRLDYFGSAVNIVSTLVRAARPGEAVLTADVFSDPGVRKILSNASASGANAAAAGGKGFLRAKLPNGSHVLVQRVKLDELGGAALAPT